MFFSPVRTEPIPERVLELCRLVNSREQINKTELGKIFEPEQLHTNVTHYFSAVFETASELGLLIVDENNDVMYAGDKSVLRSMADFRRFCNFFVFSDSNTEFYKTVVCILNSNDEWLGLGSLTASDEIKQIVNKETGIPTLTLSKFVLMGIRFWLNFLGFGYVQENPKIVFLPNMYTALKDFIALGDFEKGAEYSVRDFIDHLHKGSAVALQGARDSMRLNLAMSNALRLLHDNREIELQNNPDSAERWNLFFNGAHIIQSEVTHIVVKAVK